MDFRGEKMPMFDFEIPQIKKADNSQKKKIIEEKIIIILPNFPFWKEMDKITIKISDSLQSVSIISPKGFQFGWVSKNRIKINNITNAEQNKIFGPLLYKIQELL
ncbi:MAG: hypothetical protein BV457_07190 [Thermoplasmata archaeon M9B1D]|nr:MAG: hypothetical protein BV457_07190 [Thermoplasmata archaeon M9B1D]